MEENLRDTSQINKLSGASPPRSLRFPLLSDSFLEANLVKISKIFGGFAPLSVCSFLSVRFVPKAGKLTRDFKSFQGLRPLRVCIYYQIVPGGNSREILQIFGSFAFWKSEPSFIVKFVPGGKVTWDFILSKIFGGFAPSQSVLCTILYCQICFLGKI